MTLENWSQNPQEVSGQFLRRLNSDDYLQVEAAVYELRNTPPKALMRLLREEQVLQQQAERKELLYTMGVIACVAFAVFVTITYAPLWFRQPDSAFLMLLFYCSMAIAVKQLSARTARLGRVHSEQARKQLCAAVRANRDPALVPLILDWLNLPGRQEYRSLMPSEPCLSFCMALESLLPTLNKVERETIAQDYGHTCSYLLRETQASDGLKIAILALLEEWGASSCMSAVRSLLHANPELELTFAAQCCLLALQQREAEAKQAGTLLRASSANETAPETLLRAAIQTEDAQPEQLLRASQT